MKTILIGMVSGALMLGTGAAQNGSPVPSTSSATPTSPAQPTTQQAPRAAGNTPATPTRVAAGSVIPVSLTKTVDAKKAKTGDEVIATVTADLKTNSGEVLVPKDTKVVGHITAAQAHNKEQKESQVGIEFDHAVMKNGGEMQMPMSIQAIIGQQQNNAGQNSGGGGGGYGSEPAGSASVPSGGGGRSGGGMGGYAPSAPASSSVGSGNAPNDIPTNSRPQITEKTSGVIGISDLTLDPAVSTPNQGSVVKSEKNNVKLESGTLMLLRVNQ